MAAEGSPRFLHLNGFDLSGRAIDPAVLAASKVIYRRALDHGVKLLGDPAVVTTALEEVAATVSEKINAKDPPGDALLVRDLKAYLFTAFVRHVNRLKQKELTLVSLNEIAHIPEPDWADPLQQLERKILLDECLAHFEFIDQDLAWRRMHGRSWPEAGEVHGLSGHAAEARFSHAIKRVRKRLKIGNSKDASSNAKLRRPSAGSVEVGNESQCATTKSERNSTKKNSSVSRDRTSPRHSPTRNE